MPDRRSIVRRHESDLERLVRKQRQRRQHQQTPPPATGQKRQLPSPRDPLAIARAFLARAWTHSDGTVLLRHWRGDWWSWKTSHWRLCEPLAMRRLIYEFTETATYLNPKGVTVPWEPDKHKIDNVLDALAAICLLSNDIDQPAWLDGRTTGTIVACSNGLLDVGTRKLKPHNPSFFNVVSVPFAYEPAAGVPRCWRSFLKQLWPKDSQSRKALAEWFGYVVSGRLDFQKIFLMVGPTRAGKGTIARILTALIGAKNMVGPTLASLAADDFSLEPLIDKSLAVISDARLSGRNSSNVVVERLLSLSGEDSITVKRKYRASWTGKLPVRFFIISNELPAFGDASGAIANRFIVLVLEESWLNREDRALETRIRSHLPGILNWALFGLAHLEKRGRFTQPTSAQESISTLGDLTSPMKVFLRDCCEFDPEYEVGIDALYKAYRSWADDTGHSKIAKTTFGKELRAAFPRLRTRRHKDSKLKPGDPKSRKSDRQRFYVGLRLLDDDEGRATPASSPAANDTGGGWEASI
jgi:putative DNA primase/helicase